MRSAYHPRDTIRAAAYILLQSSALWRRWRRGWGTAVGDFHVQGPQPVSHSIQPGAYLQTQRYWNATWTNTAHPTSIAATLDGERVPSMRKLAA